MKKTILIIMLLMVGIVTATISFDKDKMQTYFNEKYPDKITVVGNSSKFKVYSKHIATEVIINNKTYTHFMSEKNYKENVAK